MPAADKAYLMLECVATEALHYAAKLDGESQMQIGRLLAALQRTVVDVLHLRALVLCYGLPPMGAAPSLRALAWKLLLGLLPPVRSEWISRLEKCRSDYASYVADLIQEPEIVACLRQGVVSSPRWAMLGPVERTPTCDHPLALPNSPSGWRSFWTDAEIFDQVNKDVYRTRVETDFFQQAAPKDMQQVTILQPIAERGSVSPKSASFRVAEILQPLTHYDRLCRILFLFSKLNFGYVQGMNELVAPVYWTFAHDCVDGHWAEADTFFAYTILMGHQRDIFSKAMDDCYGGMMGRINRVGEILQKADPVVYRHLEKFGVKLHYFALRWILLLFAQEFDLPNLQLVWDTLFADDDHKGKGGSTLVPFICVAMIVLVRTVILASKEFGDILKILQRYPPFDPREILQLAQSIRTPPALGKSNSSMSTASDDLVISTLSPSLSSQSVYNMVGKR